MALFAESGDGFAREAGIDHHGMLFNLGVEPGIESGDVLAGSGDAVAEKNDPMGVLKKQLMTLLGGGVREGDEKQKE